MEIDSALVDRARTGGDALEQLIIAVWPQAYRLSLGILRDRGLAEDAAQESCAKIAASLAGLKNSSGFATWSYRIIVRQAFDASRRCRQTDPLDDRVTCAAAFDRADVMDLYNALGTLPIVQRAAVILHYYAGFSSGEISAATGLPASTVRFHLMHARRALRKALSKDAPALVKSEEIVRNVH